MSNLASSVFFARCHQNEKTHPCRSQRAYTGGSFSPGHSSHGAPRLVHDTSVGAEKQKRKEKSASEERKTIDDDERRRRRRRRRRPSSNSSLKLDIREENVPTPDVDGSILMRRTSEIEE